MPRQPRCSDAPPADHDLRWYDPHRYGVPLWSAVFVLLPAVGLFAPRATVILLALCALPALHLRDRRLAAIGLARTAPGLFLGGLLIWGACTAFWSALPSETLLAVLKTTALFAMALLAVAWIEALEGHGAERLRRALLVGMMLGLGLLLVELIFESPLRRLVVDVAPDQLRVYKPWWFNRGISVVLLLLWPLLALAWHGSGPWAALAILVSAGAVVLIGPQISAVVTLALALSVALLAALGGRRLILPFAMVMAGLVLLMPLLVGALPSKQLEAGFPAMPSSSIHRFHVWSFVGERIAERPLQGWGFRMSRHVPGGQDKILMRGVEDVRMPLHPHNGPLQIWLELGGVGALLAAGFVFAVIAKLRRLDNGIGLAGAFGMIATGFIYSSLSYGLWQSWWLSALALASLSVLVLHGRRPTS